VGIALLIVFIGLVWWNVAWQNPRRVFEDMLANNLATRSVTKHASANGNGQGVDQYVRLEMGGTNAADWLVTANHVSSSVTTESLGTPTSAYIRYTHIETQQKSKSGKPYDFRSVLNVWGKGDGKADPSLGQLFDQSLLDIASAPLPPIANLPASEQHTVLGYMRDEHIFTPSYNNVKRETVNGRGVYTYQVSVSLGAYVRLMQAFAHDLGLNILDTIDPSQYSTVPPVVLSVSVDRASHQLVKVSYPGSGFSQSYADWGLALPIAIPHTSISTTELQKRIQSIQ
jgi:hypothetical protein